jgi:hypothetical protein
MDKIYLYVRNSSKIKTRRAKLKNIRYELLKAKNKKMKIKNKKKILDAISKFLDGETFGVFVLSEIDKKGRDFVRTLAINCDAIHSRELIKYLIENLPGLKEEVEALNQDFSHNKMVS